MGDLDCKGYTYILAEDIERIEGLKVQQKESSDPDLYEIAGIPWRTSLPRPITQSP